MLVAAGVKESIFFEGLATGRISTFLEMATHPYIHSQCYLGLVVIVWEKEYEFGGRLIEWGLRESRG